jgi:hypothetical protein
MSSFDIPDNSIRWAKDKRIMHLCTKCHERYIDIGIDLCKKCIDKMNQAELDKITAEIETRAAKLKERESKLQNIISWEYTSINYNSTQIQVTCCPNCKTECKPDQKFCNYCGSKLL